MSRDATAVGAGRLRPVGRWLRRRGAPGNNDPQVAPAPLDRSIRRRDAARFPTLPLVPLIADFSATFGTGWGPVTRRKHAADFTRFLRWLEANDLAATTGALEFLALARYVDDLRRRPKVHGVWRGSPDALSRSLAAGPAQTLSANSVNAYVRPIRSLAIWLVDEGLLAVNPFRRSRRRASLNPLLPTEETPTKSATRDDIDALVRGCAGDGPLDLRDRAIVAILVTTAARNSSVRLLGVEDVDFERSLIRFVRAKGGKTLEVALHADARQTVSEYLRLGRPPLLARSAAGADAGILFPSAAGDGRAPLGANALSLMLTRRYHAGGGSLRCFGSHRIRHATATLLVNNGMPLEEVSRYLGHSSTVPTRRYAQQTPEALGERAASALARAGLVAG
jgi:integrase/recombinase XerD